MKTFDGKKTEWVRCGHCPGLVGKEGRIVLHTDPPCEAFVEILREYGARLEDFQDVRKN